jgi:hypothetical protein
MLVSRPYKNHFAILARAGWNAAGGFSWAVPWGSLAYVFGKALEHYETIAAATAFALAIIVTVAGGLAVKKQAQDLRACAEREFPGGLRDLDKQGKQAA